jgi:hypothetical protein
MSIRFEFAGAPLRRSPPPCGEGSGVGVRELSARCSPPTPTLPRKGGGSEMLS